MDESRTQSETPPDSLPTHDGIAVLRWFTLFAALWLSVAGVLLGLLLANGFVWPGSWTGFMDEIANTSSTVKLLVFFLYFALASTFIPLPTSGVVSLVSLEQTAVASSLWATVLLVATVGAAATTLANLNDYHIFTWMLRSDRVARIRNTKMYDRASRWFAAHPFGLLVIFNIVPIPIDVVRMLATSYRYKRVPFAAANFTGRWIRYAVIAGVTFALGEDYGWIIVASLFGLAVVLTLQRLVRNAIDHWRGKKKDATS